MSSRPASPRGGEARTRGRYFMRIALQSLLAFSAAAAPQAPNSQTEMENIERAGVAVQAYTQPARGAQKQNRAWDESLERLAAVGGEIESIIEDVVLMGPEEIEILDPVVIELFSKQEELAELVHAGREGHSQGLISSRTEMKEFQELIELELSSLEEAVSFLREALDQVIGETQIEI